MEERDSKLGKILHPQSISEPLPGAAVTLVRSQGDTFLTSLPPGLVPPACCPHLARNSGNLEFGLYMCVCDISTEWGRLWGLGEDGNIGTFPGRYLLFCKSQLWERLIFIWEVWLGFWPAQRQQKNLSVCEGMSCSAAENNQSSLHSSCLWNPHLAL